MSKTFVVAGANLNPPATDIWYNKWAGGDREDSYSKYAAFYSRFIFCSNLPKAKQNLKRGVKSSKMRVLREPTLLASSIFVSFSRADAVPTGGSASFSTACPIQTKLYLIPPRTASRGTNLQTIATTWAASAVSTGRIGLCISGESKKQGPVLRLRRS